MTAAFYVGQTDYINKLNDLSTVTTALANSITVNLTTGTTTAIATANTTVLQTALSLGGDIRITLQGEYIFNSVMYIPSNTHVYIGPGVSLKIADASPSALFTNSSARLVGTVVATANAAAGSPPDGSGNYAIILTNLAGAGSNFPVGSWVSVVATGHGLAGIKGTAWNNRGYRGVYRVVASLPNTITYITDSLYPGVNNPSVPITIFPANENIKIWGPGTINGNGTNSLTTLYGENILDGNPKGVVLWWRHVFNLTIDGPNFYRGGTWTIGSNYIRNYTVKNVTAELRSGTAYTSIDFIHLSGNHQRVTIDNCAGGSGDNFIGMTVDCTDTVAAPTPNAYNFAYQSPGDMYNITIKNVYAESISAPGTYAMIGIYGPEAYRYQNIIIDGVTGGGSAGVQLANYSTTNQNLLNIDELYIRNIRISGNGSNVIINPGVYDINGLYIEKISTLTPSTAYLNISSTATGTIKSLSIVSGNYSPYDGVSFARSAPLVYLGGTAIKSLYISNIENISLNTGVYLISRVGAGTITKFVVSDVSATPFAGAAGVYSNTGGGTAPTIVYVRSSYNGTAL
jgi:hypothetical protein